MKWSSPFLQANAPQLQRLITRALVEDIGKEDITTEALFPENCPQGTGRIIAKQPLVIAGLEVAERIFLSLDPELSFHREHEDGKETTPGTVIASVSGRVSPILTGERTALNLLQHLSGIATMTRQFVEKVANASVKVMDTRKTFPGLRVLEKYAVAMGGGTNHRLGLFDAILIKDNHIQAVGGISEAVKKVREKYQGKIPVEIEARNIEEVEEALASGAEVILLDNMSPSLVEKVVSLVKGRAILEVSGGVNLENVAAFAPLGIDRISIGALTHSAPAADISLDLSLK